MYCPNCGKNIQDGLSMCPECSFSIPPQRPIGSVISMTSASSRTGLIEKLKMIPARLVAKIALLAAILCFAFPFVTISCDASEFANSFNETDDDYSMEITYKGYNFIFPSTIDEDNADLGSGFSNSSSSSDYDDDYDYDYDDDYESSSSDDKKDDDSRDARDEKPNGWLIAVVICCAVGCVLLFIKLSDWLPAVSAALSLAGIICLSLFKSNFVERYLEEDGSGSMSIENFIDIDYRFGYHLCMLFMIIGLIACAITFLTDKFRYDKNF